MKHRGYMLSITAIKKREIKLLAEVFVIGHLADVF